LVLCEELFRPRAALRVWGAQHLLPVGPEEIEGDEVRRPLGGEPGRALAAGDRSPMEHFERHALLGPHDQLAV
jgi:hypothetical protein